MNVPSSRGPRPVVTHRERWGRSALEKKRQQIVEGTLVGIATLDDDVATAGEMLDDVATVIEWQSREIEPDE